ncbi:hypothetical protein PL373_08060 [Tenacibaculum maritimum]|nr:hypothetical protein [Tenacibaculum maritimum]MDB0601100.1 hypothetical protein [Tenacibaculum maritimum]MDB0612182.1 hypothetical protein [Tenacibaculum maritimum]
MSWILKETDTGQQEEIHSHSEFNLKEAFFKGMCINYSVTHNGWIKQVDFIKTKS